MQMHGMLMTHIFQYIYADEDEYINYSQKNSNKEPRKHVTITVANVYGTPTMSRH